MFERIKRLYELSGTERHLIIPPEKIEAGTIITVPKGINPKNVHKQAVFIPRIKENPVQKIVNEQPQ